MTTPMVTLYDRMGGEAGVAAMLDQFYARVLADPELAGFFKDASLDKLLRMQKEFFGAALGGPQSYGGLDLSWAHAGRGITSQHFNFYAQHLLATLESLGLPPDDVRETVHRISVHKNDITGEGY